MILFYSPYGKIKHLLLIIVYKCFDMSLKIWQVCCLWRKVCLIAWFKNFLQLEIVIICLI